MYNIQKEIQSTCTCTYRQGSNTYMVESNQLHMYMYTVSTKIIKTRNLFHRTWPKRKRWPLSWIPCSGKFSNGANFHIFRTRATSTNIRAYTKGKGISEITQFFLTRWLFVCNSTPYVPVNMVAAYHRLNGERSMCHDSKVQISITRVSGGVAWSNWKSQNLTSKFYSNRKLEFMGKFSPTEIFRYTVILNNA